MSKKPQTLAAIRARIKDLAEQRADVLALPVAHETVRDNIRAWLDRLQERNARAIAGQLAQFSTGAGSLFPALAEHTGGPADVGRVLVMLFTPDELLDKLARHIDALPEGITAPDRADRVAALDAQIVAAEHEEMDAIEQAEAAGDLFEWRASQSPAVVLRITTPTT